MPVLKPKQSWTITPASQRGTAQEQRVLLIGQMTDSGTATADTLYQDISNDNSWDTLFGADSQLAGMCREFRNLNEITDLDVYPMADPGTESYGTCSIAFSGTATEAGTLYVSVGSAQNHKYTLTIASGDTASGIGAALVSDITEDTNAPFNAGNVDGTVTITCVHAGALSADWSIGDEGSVAGITMTLVGWGSSPGTGNPVTSNIATNIANVRYQTIVWPYSALDETDLVTLLDERFNVAYKIMDGVGVVTKVGTASACVSYADQNSQSWVVLANKSASRAALKGSAIVEMPAIISTEFAAERALRMTEDAVLANFQTTTASNDQYGGPHIRSLPYFNTRMPNLPVAAEVDEFTQTEMNVTLSDGGVSYLSSNRAYNAVILGEIVTTYLTDAAGNSNTSFKFLNTVDTSSYIREYFYESFRSEKGQNRLTDGEVAAGYAIDNEGTLRAYCLSLYKDLANEQLVHAGASAEDDYMEYLTVTLDLANGKVTINQSPLLVSQLRTVIGTIQVAFSRS